MVDKSTQAEPHIEEDVPPDPLIGRVLNERFRITERLGQGGMGTVYKAVQSPLDRVVALKILNTQYGAGKDPGFQKRFFLEAAVTSKLRHPNTITVIDYGRAEENLFYIAMEYVEGETLAQLLTTHGALPWPRALHVAMQVCRSLREAHKAGVIHRDLKPANVMVLHEENDADLVKVLDFGLVKSFLAEQANPSDTELTQAGVFLGSPQYMAPEQAKNQAGPRSDIYSLGVVLYQMLMGEPPFRGAQSIDVIVKHINSPPPPMRARRPELEIPAEVEALVMRCLAKDPAKRFQTMDELLEGLRRAGAAGGLSGVFTHSGVGSGPNSGVYTPPPIPRRSDSGPQSGPRTVALRPAVPPEAIAEGSGSKTMPVARRRLLPILLFVAAVIGGGGLTAFWLLGAQPPPATNASTAPVTPPATVAPSTPAAVVEAPAPVEEQAPEPRLIRFRVESTPDGAVVNADGRRIGVTPTEFELVAGEDGRATTEIGLALDGYQPISVTASGSGDEVVRINQRLKRKKSSPTPPRPRPASGYKEDPYQ